nr:N-alpha-acetyltransferase 30 [Polyrhizophydium stewartii]
MSEAGLAESAATATPADVEYSLYKSEEQLPQMAALIDNNLSEPYTTFTYRYFLHSTPSVSFVATDRRTGALVGVIICKLSPHRERLRGYIGMLVVAHEYRKMGIGSALVKVAVEEMRRHDADEVTLETEITNLAALSLYQRLGFVRDKRLNRYYLSGRDAFRIRDIHRAARTRARTRDLDQIFEDMAKPEESFKGPANPDLPGMGQNYCIPCARHFITPEALEDHRKTKLHKKRVRVLATEQPYTQKDAELAVGMTTDNVSECVGIYSARDVAGARPGSIDVKFTPYAPQGQVALAFVNYLDTGLLARRTTGSFALCTAFDISAGLCEPSELGKVHVLRAANDSRVAPIVTERVLWAPPGTPALSALPEPERRRLERRQSQPASSLPASASSSAAASSAASVTSSAGAATSSAAAPTSSAQPAPTSSSLPSPSPSPSPSPAPIVYVQNSTMRFKYEIESSGLYCVIILTDLQSDYDYGLDITISNPYGLLPGLFYPALVFYGVISMAYLAVGVVWMVLSFRYWSDLLPIQHYVSGVIAFLILEMAFNFGLYENFNKTGVVSTFLMVLVVVFNAGRVSLSFFMLLIVSLGYGVVK